MAEDKIVGGMATLPERQEEANDVIRRVAPQFDKLYVACHDGFNCPSGDSIKGANIQPFTTGRRDDARKFAPLEKTQAEDFYYFTLDDDLIYPPDYVERMTDFIDKWEQEIIACVHGSWIEQFPCESYYKDKQAVHFAVGLFQSVQVLFPGTGTMALHTSAIAPQMGNFPLHNIADVQMAIAAQRAQVPILTIPRTDTWLQQHPEVNALQDSIWAERRNADEDETDLINGFAKEVGWALPDLPESQAELQTEEQ